MLLRESKRINAEAGSSGRWRVWSSRMEKMKELEENLRKLGLSKGEAADIFFDEEEDEELKYKEARSIVGKVCSTRVISKKVLGSNMVKVWRISKAEKFLEVCSNTFVIIFKTYADKEKVWARRPLLFENYFLAMKRFDGFTPPPPRGWCLILRAFR